jgi:23S rRNA pseudouridine2604 synthase
MEKIEYPIRINRFLYLNNVCSRRQADRFIEQGMILINGEKAVIGQKVNEDDKVEVADFVADQKKNFKYYIFNKPAGVNSGAKTDREKHVDDVFKEAKHLHVIGRLDKASTGLLFLTDDTRLVDKMLNPDNEHEKEYVVRVDKSLKPSFKNKMERGVDIEGYMTRPAKVEVTGEKAFKITLTEGKKHQIRRMCAALGYQVKDLKRIRMMNLKLGTLPFGKAKKLPVQTKLELLKDLGLI